MNSNIIKLLTFSILVICSYSFYAQNTLIVLDVKNANKNNLSYPCISINDCIDSIYKYNDTLFILLEDTRKFYQDERATVVLSQGYKINKRNVEVLIQNDLNCNFVILKTFDFLCVFKKHKEERAIYKLISIEEIVDYSNKKIIDIKNNKDIIIR